MTHLLEDSTNQITLRLPLLAGQRNCTISIKSEGAESVQFIVTGQSEWALMLSGYEYHYLLCALCVMANSCTKFSTF